MANVLQLLVSERECIQRLSLVTGHAKDVVRDVLNAELEFLIDELRNGVPVRLGKLGEFEVVEKKCQGGYNFHTGQMGKPKLVQKIKFTPSRKFRLMVEKSDDAE